MPRVPHRTPAQPRTLALAATALLAAIAPVSAQIHRVAKAEPVTRAVAVYEYAGELKQPTAARLIPVSLFIGGHYEDAGTYLARPIPFALGTDTVYELQHAGEPLGTLDLAYAKNLRGSSAEVTVPFDQAWFGYGRFTPAKSPGSTEPKPGARHTQTAYATTDDGKPHFGSKPDSTPTPRNRRDTTDVDPDADRAQKVSLPNDDRDPDAPNPDRPTLRRRPADTTGGPKGKKPKETASVTATPVSPDKDPDRPTIKRKESVSSPDDGIPPDPSEVSSTRSTHGTGGTVSAANTAAANGVLSDNGRPELRRNPAGGSKPAAAANPGTTNGGTTATGIARTQADALPDLAPVAAPGLPPDLHFAVAVSDFRDRAPHDFHTAFATDAERTAALAEMRTLALAVLQNPSLATDALDFAPTGASRTAVGSSRTVPGGTAMSRTGSSSPATGSTSTTDNTAPRAHTTTHSAAAKRAGATRTRNAKPATHAAASGSASTLADEQFDSYTLSYSSPLTLVYTAHTTAAPVRFVTVVAERNADGKLEIRLRSVTDATHLDRTPRYRLVDAVDADATNRADLLFEVRNSTSRQFALYRFLGTRPDQVFITGTTK